MLAALPCWQLLPCIAVWSGLGALEKKRGVVLAAGVAVWWLRCCRRGTVDLDTDCALIVQDCEQHAEGDGEQQQAQQQRRASPAHAAGDCSLLHFVGRRDAVIVQTEAICPGLWGWGLVCCATLRGSFMSKDWAGRHQSSWHTHQEVSSVQKNSPQPSLPRLAHPSVGVTFAGHLMAGSPTTQGGYKLEKPPRGSQTT
jgi:hypothetical protein